MSTSDGSGAASTAENALSFCSYLVEKLFARWRANAAVILQTDSSGGLEPLASFGWISRLQESESFKSALRQHFLRDLSARQQALFPSLARLNDPIDDAALVEHCKSLLFVANEPTGDRLGALLVTFASELEVDDIEQLRRAIPMLRASLNLFLGVEPEPAWAKRYPLTSRQVSILRDIISGLTYRDISKSLWVSESTIKQEAKRIFLIIGVKNRFEAAKALRETP